MRSTSTGDVKPNFRQVGTKVSGTVMRGAVTIKQPAPDLKQKVSSIPSKYETVLHREFNEYDGFGQRTLRFGDSENELPGPGQYYKPSSLVRSTLDSGSVSRLGYTTGFVSKSARFDDRLKMVMPGPGQYQPKIDDRKTYNMKHGLSCFVNTVKRSNSQSFQNSVPGPGDYNVVHPFEASSHNILKSAFTSKTSRGWNIQTGTPAPGQYENFVQLGQSQQGKNSSVFKSSVKRLEPKKAFTPGPGAYNVDHAESALRCNRVAKSHTSAVFRDGNTDRFGHLLTNKDKLGTVGPGTYEVLALPDKQGSASVFKSTTSRTEGTTSLTWPVPGPAFYHPVSPEKRSYLHNSTQKWM